MERTPPSPVVAPETKSKQRRAKVEWAVADARGVKRALFDAPAVESVAAERLGMEAGQVRRLYEEASMLSRFNRRFAILASGLSTSVWIMMTLDRLAQGQTWRGILIGVAALSGLVAFVLSFRMSRGIEPGRFAPAMLARGRCPSCGYLISGCPPVPPDDARVCPECGGAWKLPDSQGATVT